MGVAAAAAAAAAARVCTICGGNALQEMIVVIASTQTHDPGQNLPAGGERSVDCL